MHNVPQSVRNLAKGLFAGTLMRSNAITPYFGLISGLAAGAARGLGFIHEMRGLGFIHENIHTRIHNNSRIVSTALVAGITGSILDTGEPPARAALFELAAFTVTGIVLGELGGGIVRNPDRDRSFAITQLSL